MEFVVLARKLRPARFAHLVGQETVVQALRNAIRTDRVAHAFLFAGSRGVGKTSTARILTKALNCERPQDGEPCDECDNCREIALNTSPDVFEIDAASNRGIDNIRELRENTKYTPVKCRYKTYIIDEAHMLTMESFNALLKTLEEPPPHVKFILATTNPHRLPDTIVSRCQRYDFPRLAVPVLTDYLAKVTADEGIRLSRPALEMIARNAAGGVRDALTAVDQVVSYAGQEASDEQVLGILGLTDHREVMGILGAVLDKDLPAALTALATVRERGHDLDVLLEALIREVKDYTLFLTLPDGNLVYAAHPPETLAFFRERKGRVTLDELQQLFYLLLEVEAQIKRSDFALACFEMGLVKACRIEPLVGIDALLAQARALTGGEVPAPSAPAPAQAAPAARAAAAPAPTPRPAAPGPAPAPGPAAAPAQGAPAGDEFARIAARAQARTREAGRSGATATARATTDRGNEDADEAEPAAAPPASAQPAPVVPTSPPPPSPPPAVAPPAVTANRANGSGGTAPEVATDAAAPPAATTLEEAGPALCDDPRWRALVEELGNGQQRLAAKLRRAEVTAFEAQQITVLPADDLSRPTPEELAALGPALERHFGAAFHIALADDTKGKAREAHTIAGRNRLEEAARLAARRAAAEGDPQVQRLLRAFPSGRIVEVTLSEEPARRATGSAGVVTATTGSEDVQG